MSVRPVHPLAPTTKKPYPSQSGYSNGPRAVPWELHPPKREEVSCAPYTGRYSDLGVQTRSPPSQSFRSSGRLGTTSPIQQRLCAGFSPDFPFKLVKAPVYHLGFSCQLGLCFIIPTLTHPCQVAQTIFKNEEPPPHMLRRGLSAFITANRRGTRCRRTWHSREC